MIKSRFRDFDWMLLGIVMVLSVVSVLEIRSATEMTKFHGFQQKQMVFLVVGLVGMFVFALVDYHRLLGISYWAYGFSLVSLLAVKVVGTKVLGARRWINLGGGVHFQPSEWVRLILILVAARFFWEVVENGRDLTWKDIGKAFLLIGVPLVLVGGVGLWSGKLLKPYQQQRLTAFMNPDSDPQASGYQIKQSLIAVGSGGLWGKGQSKGTQTQGDFLPIPYTDFIFAAFCEEHGFIGAIGVLLLYFLILVRLIQNAQTAADPAGSLIVMGIAAVLLFQIAVNIGMCVGLMPVTGIPLPLMSYGGSSIIYMFLALGIVMNVRMRRFVN